MEAISPAGGVCCPGLLSLLSKCRAVDYLLPSCNLIFVIILHNLLVIHHVADDSQGCCFRGGVGHAKWKEAIMGL
jgi:hypothetical protein